MKRWLLVAVLACSVATGAGAQVLPKARPEEVGVSSARLGVIGQVLQADVEGGKIPGAVVAIARRGKLVYYESFGFLDKAAGTPMPKDAIFSIASMTKPFVTVGTLMLMEEGRLSISEPVATYLPELASRRVAASGAGSDVDRVNATESARSQPTLQDLMRHTAGFTYGSGANAFMRLYPPNVGRMTAKQFLDTLGVLPLHYQPGTAWEYGLGFDILGIALERISGKSLGTFLDERLFRPLGMADTGFLIPSSKAQRFARALATNPVTGAPQSFPDKTVADAVECGGGCGVSTAMDYLRFAQMLLDQGTLGDSRMLGPKTVRYMISDHLGPDADLSALHRAYPYLNGYGFGLGVAVRRGDGGASIFGTKGDFNWGGANGTYFWVDPQEELAVVFMAAAPGAMRIRYRQLMTSLVLQALTD